MKITLGILPMLLKYKVAWILIVVIGCDVTEPVDCATKNNYPSKIAPLSTVENNNLQAQFDTLNNDELCNHEFNSFGVIQQASICRLGGIMTQGTEGLMIMQAKQLVVRLSEFSYVSDTSLLRLERNGGIGVSTERMLVVFKNQVYEGFEVMDTQISVQVYENGARAIHGSWQEKITIPGCESITEGDAIETALGTEIKYWTHGGPGTLTVSAGMLQGGAVQVIVPIIQDDIKEFHLAWRFLVNGGWYLYIDIFDGAVLRTDQLWIS